jgi:hypothetical protein
MSYNRNNSKRIAGISKQFLKFFDTEFRITQNASQNFWMEDLGSVKGDRGPFPGDVLVNHVTATLPDERETSLFKHADNLARCKAGKFGH